MLALALMSATQEPNFAEWGREALAMIRRDYYLPKSKLYAEKPDKKQPAFNWGVGVMLSALNAAAKSDPTYKSHLREYADATRIYWNDGGYDVLPAPKPKDRYYDDNAWMALALAETHQILGDEKYLTWALDALNFALEGEAKEGGIYWRESDRASRNTCSNAPTAAACLAIYQINQDPKLKAKAEQLYAWTKTHLQDPADSLFWDALNNDGKIEKTKWTYNTALMIRTAHDLHLFEAPTLMLAARRKWLVENKIKDPARFAHLLFEAMISVHGVTPEYPKVLENVRNARNSKGHYPGHWSELKVGSNPEILDQASFARACFILAEAQKKG